MSTFVLRSTASFIHSFIHSSTHIHVLLVPTYAAAVSIHTYIAAAVRACGMELRICLPHALIGAGLLIILGGAIAFALVGRNEPVTRSSSISSSSTVSIDELTNAPTFWFGKRDRPSFVPSQSVSSAPTSQPTVTSAEPTPIPSNSPASFVTDQTTARKTFHTVIVGAGAAGLSAHYTLQNDGLKLPSDEIRILEAASTFGGRVKKNTTFATHPLDLGASFVQYDDEIEAIVGSDRLTTPDGTGLPVFVNYSWFDFFRDYIAPRKSDVIEYGCRVVMVDYVTNSSNNNSDDAVVSRCEDGRMFFSDYAIVTVPLSILRDGEIDFRPSLPRSMTVDHPGLPFWEGLKVFLEVRSANFLDDNHIESIAFDGYLTETGENLFWKQQSLDNGNHIIAGYLLGDQSLPFIRLEDEEIIERILLLLDDQYNGKASRFYVRGFVKNWSRDDNVRGTLSSWGYDKPVSEGGPGYPSGAQNIANKVWIAGESFPIDGENGWVDSGVFSGDDAAKQIIEMSQGLQIDDLFWARLEKNLSER